MTATILGAPVRLIGLARVPNGTVIGLVFVLCANAGCVAGVAGLVTIAFIGGGFGIALLLARVRPLAALEFALWLWVLGPQVRRMVDLSTGYHEPSLILLAAPLASLVTLPSVHRLRRLDLVRWVRPLLVAVAAMTLGYVVGAARIGLQPATAALLSWIAPVLFGLQLIAVGDDVDDLRATVERFLTWSTLIVGVYGVAQFYIVPPWDALWMDNAPMNSIGVPEPFEIRVFSTLNSPGPMAVFLAAALLYLAGARHAWRVPAQVAGYAALALSLVRSAWLAWLLGIVLVVAAGRSRARTTAVIAVIAIAVCALQLSGPMQQVVADRLDETREGRQDDSLVERLALHRAMVPALAGEAIGNGLGATGNASTLGTDSSTGLAVLDSGLIDFGYSLGLPAGLLALGALWYGGLELARAGLRRGVVGAEIIAGGASVLVQLLFGNALAGVGGVMFFLLWALALRDLVEASSSTGPRFMTSRAS